MKESDFAELLAHLQDMISLVVVDSAQSARLLAYLYDIQEEVHRIRESRFSSIN